MNPWNTGQGDFILQARVETASTLGKSNFSWRPSKAGDEYGLEIVHTHPDGAGHGGHLILYGKGDDAATWFAARLVGPIGAPEGKKA
jgi:hypothetical protein